MGALTLSFHYLFIYFSINKFTLIFFLPPKILYYLWELTPQGLGMFDCNYVHVIP